MIVWRTVDEWFSELSACATHPEFVNHLASRVHTVTNIWSKQAPVSHCLERVWKLVHEIHSCLLTVPNCLQQTQCMLEGNTVLRARRVSYNSHMNAKCRNPRAGSFFSWPESIGDPISNNFFEFSTNYLHLFRQSALLKSHFGKSRVT